LVVPKLKLGSRGKHGPPQASGLSLRKRVNNQSALRATIPREHGARAQESSSL
jgi:hypothetical protein